MMRCNTIHFIVPVGKFVFNLSAADIAFFDKNQHQGTHDGENINNTPQKHPTAYTESTMTLLCWLFAI